METIYTNGKSLFTLEDYSKTAGVSEHHKISIYDTVKKEVLRAMHEKGQVHYIFGTGDRKELANISLNRKLKLKGFEIS